jgi:hypothetical protein
MRYGVLFEETDFYRLKTHLLCDPESEQAAYLLCGVSQTLNEIRWLVRDIVPVPFEGFLRRERYGLTISAGFTDTVVQRARSENLAIILTHSHPFDHGTTRYSPVDDRGETGLFDVYRKRVPTRPHASLLFGADCLTGRHWTQDGAAVDLDFVRVVGRTTSTPFSKTAGAITAVHARQVLAFGPGGQQRISAASAAVVGVGGTGSITAEQLIRLGIGRVILVDAETIEASNVSRVFGSVQNDIASKTAKVEALTRWAAQISPGTRVDAHPSSVLEPEIAAKLREADVIFGCTDNHTSRALLNQMSFQYLIPYIDMGNRIAAHGNRVTAGTGRVVVMTPLAPCLWCYEDIRAKTITEEALPPEERERLGQEGYIEGAQVENPAVISLNTLISGLAVTEGLNLFAQFLPPGPPGYKLHYRLMEQTVEKVVVTKLSPCICARDGEYWGYGDCRDLPTHVGVTTA